MSNFFDPKSFAAGGLLDGQVADIVECKATKFDYNGKVDPPANVIEMKIVRADDKERTEVYGTGAAEPTEDGTNVKSGLNKQCKFAGFLFALTKTKFPMKELAENGLWGSLGAALLTLFQVLTLEGWVELQRTGLAATPWAWLFYTSFVVVAVFVVVNLFIAVVISNLEAAKRAEARVGPAPAHSIAQIRARLDELEAAIESGPTNSQV